MGRDLLKEREAELSAIWGSEEVGGLRFPKRRGAHKKLKLLPDQSEAVELDDVLSSDGENHHETGDGKNSSSTSKKANPAKTSKAKKSAAGKRKLPTYQLHCFVEPGTNKNDVRAVFEQYEPEVTIGTSQKGNALNKAQYCVLKFRNKAMALHAVKVLDGSNQRDTMGVASLKLSIKLSREMNKIVRRRRAKRVREERERRLKEEAAEEERFIQDFLAQHTTDRAKKR